MAAHRGQRAEHGRFQGVQTGRRKVGELAGLCLAPDVFDRRRSGGQGGSHSTRIARPCFANQVSGQAARCSLLRSQKRVKLRADSAGGRGRSRAPRGARVRRQTGRSRTSVSSKTRLRPARRAFSYLPPPLGPPAPDGRLVPLPSAAFRLLAAPAAAAEDRPDVSRGALHEEREESILLPGRQPWRAPGRRLRPERVWATRSQSGLPAAHGRGGAPDLPSDVAYSPALHQERHRLPTAGFQPCGTPLCSHAWQDRIVSLFMLRSTNYLPEVANFAAQTPHCPYPLCCIFPPT